MVFDSRHARTARLAQSMIATKYRKPCAIGMYVMSAAQTWFWRRDRQPAQQVGMDLVSRRRLARARTRRQRLYPHHPHQPPHPLAVHAATFGVQREGHAARAVEGQIEVQGVDAAHQRQIVRRNGRLGVPRHSLGVDRMVSTSWSGRRWSSPAARQGRALARGLEGHLPLQHPHVSDQTVRVRVVGLIFLLPSNTVIYREHGYARVPRK